MMLTMNWDFLMLLAVFTAGDSYFMGDVTLLHVGTDDVVKHYGCLRHVGLVKIDIQGAWNSLRDQD